MPDASKPINCEALKTLVRTVPDFPKPGILFYDITTLLKDKAGFAQMIDADVSQCLYVSHGVPRRARRTSRIH